MSDIGDIRPHKACFGGCRPNESAGRVWSASAKTCRVWSDITNIRHECGFIFIICLNNTCVLIKFENIHIWEGNPCLITALPLRCMNTQTTSYSNIVMTFKHTNILLNGILISPTYRAKMCKYFKPNPMKIRPVVQKLCPIEGSVHFKAYSHEITSKQTPPCEMT